MIERLRVAASVSLVMATGACGARSQLFDFGGSGGSGPDGGEALQTYDGGTPVDAPAPTEASISPPEAGISSSRPCVMLGANIDRPTSTTWIWDGATWTQRLPAVSPNSRTSATAAALGGTMMVFGGYETISNGTTYGNDTWTWDGTTWTQQSPSQSPPALASAAAATLNGKTYLFGGINPGFVYGDTWQWDGTNWTHLTPAQSPPARAYATLVSDGSRLILFGGTTANSGSADLLDDTWAWDGTTWTQLEPAVSPPSRRAASAAQLGNGFVLFGGQALGNDPYAPLTYVDDTWAWQAGSWTHVTPAVTPPARSFAAMASPGNAVVMAGGFRPPPDGGYVYLDDTWTWDGSLWSEHTTAAHPDGLDLDGAVMACP